MKKCFTKLMTLLLLVFISGGAFAQKKLLAVYTESYSTGTYTPYDSVVSEYDAQKRLVKETRKLYTSGAWNVFSKKEFTHLTSGEVENITFFSWSNNAWVKTLEYRHSYNANNKLETIERYKWMSGAWEKNYEDRYQYLGNGKIDSINVVAVDASQNEMPYERIKYAYTPNGDIASTTSERWSATGSVWELKVKWAYYYEADNSLVKLEEDNYLGGNWLHIHHYAYTYDNDKLLREALHKNSANGQIIGRAKYIYEGDPTNVGIPALPLSVSVNFFPNPVTTNATLSWEANGDYTVTINDISGKTVIETGVANNSSISFTTETLGNGVYFYTLKNTFSGVAARGRFVVEK